MSSLAEIGHAACVQGPSVHVRRVALVLILSCLHGCTPVCGDEPLTPTRRTVAWAVHFTDALNPPSISLYQDDGTLIAESWLAPFATWPSQLSPFSTASRLSFHHPEGQLFLALGDDRRTITGFDTQDGTLHFDLHTTDTPYPESAEIRDILQLANDLVIASQGAGPLGIGFGDDLVIVDPLNNTLRRLSLGSNAGETLAPHRMATIPNQEALLVPLAMPDAPNSGAVTWVQPRENRIQRTLFTGTAGCTEIARIPDTSPAQFALLCRGHGNDRNTRQTQAAILVLELNGEQLVELQRWPGSHFGAQTPSESLVATHTDHVVVLSRSDASGDLPDALIELNLRSGAFRILAEELWDLQQGPSLGSGDFNPQTQELVWPSIQHGLLRWERSPDGQLTPTPSLPPLPCMTGSPRVARAISPSSR